MKLEMRSCLPKITEIFEDVKRSCLSNALYVEVLGYNLLKEMLKMIGFSHPYLR